MNSRAVYEHLAKMLGKFEVSEVTNRAVSFTSELQAIGQLDSSTRCQLRWFEQKPRETEVLGAWSKSELHEPWWRNLTPKLVSCFAFAQPVRNLYRPNGGTTDRLGHR